MMGRELQMSPSGPVGWCWRSPALHGAVRPLVAFPAQLCLCHSRPIPAGNMRALVTPVPPSASFTFCHCLAKTSVLAARDKAAFSSPPTFCSDLASLGGTSCRCHAPRHRRARQEPARAAKRWRKPGAQHPHSVSPSLREASCRSRSQHESTAAEWNHVASAKIRGCCCFSSLDKAVPADRGQHAEMDPQPPASGGWSWGPAGSRLSWEVKLCSRDPLLIFCLGGMVKIDIWDALLLLEFY